VKENAETYQLPWVPACNLSHTCGTPMTLYPNSQPHWVHALLGCKPTRIGGIPANPNLNSMQATRRLWWKHRFDSNSSSSSVHTDRILQLSHDGWQHRGIIITSRINCNQLRTLTTCRSEAHPIHPMHGSRRRRPLVNGGRNCTPALMIWASRAFDCTFPGHGHTSADWSSHGNTGLSIYNNNIFTRL